MKNSWKYLSDKVVKDLNLISTETFLPSAISMDSEIGTSSFIVIRDSFGADTLIAIGRVCVWLLKLNLKFQFHN